MRFLFLGIALLGFFSVALGAAEDHLLDGKLTPEIDQRFDVALRYHQIYSLVLLATFFGWRQAGQDRILFAALCLFLSGAVAFSGSLYLSIFAGYENMTLMTPVGGLCLMAGWLSLAFYALRLPHERSPSK